MKLGLLVGTMLLTFSVSGAMAGNGPSNAVYGGKGGSVQGSLSGSGPSSGQLPFTGFDLLLLVGAAIVLIAVGLGVRRLARNDTAKV